MPRRSVATTSLAPALIVSPHRSAAPSKPIPTVPDVVTEAFRRLAEYIAAKAGKAGATAENISAGSVSISHRRSRVMDGAGHAE